MAHTRDVLLEHTQCAHPNYNGHAMKARDQAFDAAVDRSVSATHPGKLAGGCVVRLLPTGRQRRLPTASRVAPPVWNALSLPCLVFLTSYARIICRVLPWCFHGHKRQKPAGISASGLWAFGDVLSVVAGAGFTRSLLPA